jgi:hypothetical protein
MPRLLFLLLWCPCPEIVCAKKISLLIIRFFEFDYIFPFDTQSKWSIIFVVFVQAKYEAMSQERYVVDSPSQFVQ